MIPLGAIHSTQASGAVASGKPADESDALKAARQFEAILIKQLLANVKLSGGDGGPQADFVDSMWRDQISTQMSKQGLGLAAVIAQQLNPQSTTGGSGSKGLEFGSMPAPVTPVQRTPGPGLKLYENLLPDPPKFNSPEEFVQNLKPYINKAAAELGVSPQVIMAQAALETGWGKHMPANGSETSRNLFGIKADRSWHGPRMQSATQEFDGRQMNVEQAGFRQYGSFADSIKDYVDFLRTQPRYTEALNHGGSDEKFVQGLKSAGYATDPQYVDKILEIAESPRLNELWSAS